VIIYVRDPVAEAYIVDHTSVRNRSTVLGIYYFSIIEGSGVITPAIGYLIDQLGFYPSFTIAGASLLAITLICSILLWRLIDG
jgi:MFS family permease